MHCFAASNDYSTSVPLLEMVDEPLDEASSHDIDATIEQAQHSGDDGALERASCDVNEAIRERDESDLHEAHDCIAAMAPGSSEASKNIIGLQSIPSLVIQQDQSSCMRTSGAHNTSAVTGTKLQQPSTVTHIVREWW